MSYPDPLPPDVGSELYIFAHGSFAKYGELTVDDICPVDSDDQYNQAKRSQVAEYLANPDKFHFLFGDPGVLGVRGRYLYHYTKIDYLNLIAENGLRLGAMSTKNDPLEARKWTKTPLAVKSSTIGGASPEERDSNDAKNFFEEVESLRLRALAVSFGSDAPLEDEDRLFSAPRRGYLNPAMWSHYGDSHSGACLIFDRLLFNKSATQSLGATAVAQDVIYTSDFTQGTDLWLYEAGKEIPAQQYLDDRRETLLFTKNDEWAYEHEYRWCVVHQDDEKVEEFVPIGEALVGMVLGDQTDESRQELAFEFARRLAITANVAICDWSNPQFFNVRRLSLANDE